VSGEPVEIQKSLARFCKDYPEPLAVAFLMMKFGETPAHKTFVQTIREAFAKHGIEVLRADDREYHDDLFPNVRTYMHGCGLGIAVFERIEADDFNPNVSLEVGYMLAMGKPVCLLKDKTLKTLQSDLVGKLYKPFDTQNAKMSLPKQIDKWISDKGLSRKPKESTPLHIDGVTTIRVRGKAKPPRGS
jgi:nucleoside 2-deoxyribosyltransferase